MERASPNTRNDVSDDDDDGDDGDADGLSKRPQRTTLNPFTHLSVTSRELQAGFDWKIPCNKKAV